MTVLLYAPQRISPFMSSSPTTRYSFSDVATFSTRKFKNSFEVHLLNQTAEWKRYYNLPVSHHHTHTLSHKLIPHRDYRLDAIYCLNSRVLGFPGTMSVASRTRLSNNMKEGNPKPKTKKGMWESHLSVFIALGTVSCLP
jgi:hypothetical protein